MDEIKVTVLCLAYNHKKYIRQCLDGILSQKTNFRYEVIIHDDASTDTTTDIIKEYQIAFPEIINPVFQKQNQHKLGKKLPDIYREILYPRVRGKYIAYCECDDFWGSEDKLQLQVNVMEENEKCNLCLHCVRTISEEGIPENIRYPELSVPEGWIEQREFFRGLTDGKFFHTSSFLCRSEVIKKLCNDIPEFYKISYVDDVPLLLYMGYLGGVWYIDKEMSYYRRNSEGSWTATRAKSVDKIIESKQELIELYRLFNQYSNGKYAEVCEHWIYSEKVRIAEYEGDYKEMMKNQYAEFLAARGGYYRKIVVILGMLQRAMIMIRKILHQ